MASGERKARSWAHTCRPPSRSIHLCFHSFLTITTPPFPQSRLSPHTHSLALLCGSLQNQPLSSRSGIYSRSTLGCLGGNVELSRHDSAAPRAPGPGGLGLVSKPRELVQSRLGRKGKFLQVVENKGRGGKQEAAWQMTSRIVAASRVCSVYLACMMPWI